MSVGSVSSALAWLELDTREAHGAEFTQERFLKAIARQWVFYLIITGVTGTRHQRSKRVAVKQTKIQKNETVPQKHGGSKTNHYKRPLVSITVSLSLSSFSLCCASPQHTSALATTDSKSWTAYIYIPRGRRAHGKGIYIYIYIYIQISPEVKKKLQCEPRPLLIKRSLHTYIQTDTHRESVVCQPVCVCVSWSPTPSHTLAYAAAWLGSLERSSRTALYYYSPHAHHRQWGCCWRGRGR